MTPTPIRFAAAFVALLGAAAVIAIVAPRDGVGQEAKQVANAGTQAPGALHCIGCHGGPDTDQYRAYADRSELRTDFVRLDEQRTWKTNDLHSQAFLNIQPVETSATSGNLAWRIQESLRRSPTRDKKYQVIEAAECLTCHSEDRAPNPKLIDDKKTDQRFYIRDGVSCEACHGPITGDWIGAHFFKKWRETDPLAKRDAGQIDLRDPYKKATKCASCHIGNRAEGKFVTHEMYAAGHPPLPAFELVTFCRDQPGHYFPANENKWLLSQAKENKEAIWKNFHFRSDERADVRAFVIGTVVAFETATKLLAADAVATKDADALDFAHFDCYACHHDLKVPSDRQAQGRRLPPGRPTLRAWPTESLKVVLKHAGDMPGVPASLNDSLVTFNGHMKTLDGIFAARPFGTPSAVASEAKDLASFGVTFAMALDDAKYDETQVKRLYALMVERVRAMDNKNPDKKPYLDYEVAQHAAWSLAVLRKELGMSDKSDDVNAVVRLALRDAKGPRLSVEKRGDDRLKPIGLFENAAFLKATGKWLEAKGP